MAKVDLPKVRAQYQSDVSSDAKISLKEAKDLAKAAGTKEGREFLEERLAQDQFDPDARTLLEKAVAKKLTPSEKAEMKASGLGASGLAGQEVGTMTGNFKVTVKRELGPREGFQNENQARAQALLSGVQPTAIVKDQGGRWHAVQLTLDPTDFKKSLSPSGAAADLKVVKPDAQALKQAQADYDSAPDGDAKNKAYEKLVAAALGVDPQQVHFAGNVNQLDPSKINIGYRLPDGPSVDGMHGNLIDNPDGKTKTFTSALPDDKKSAMGKSTIWLSAGANGKFDLTDPKKLATFRDTYLHESTHEAHSELAMAELGKWRGSKSKKDFHAWMNDEVKAGRLSETDHRLIADAVQTGMDGKPLTDTRDTEALSYTQAFVGSFGKSQTQLPFDQLQATFESNHAPQTDAVKNTIKHQLQEMYDGLSPNDRKAFTDFLSSNKSVKGSWLDGWKPS